MGDVLSIADEIDDDTSAKRAHATLFLVLFSLGCTTCLNSRHLLVVLETGLDESISDCKIAARLCGEKGVIVSLSVFKALHFCIRF